jgi:hypothetical protein
MVSEQDLIELACPPKNLKSVIPQYYTEIRDLERFRKGEIPEPRRFPDATDLRTYVRTQIEQSERGVFATTPFDLLTRIHYTEGRSVPAPKGTEPREVTEIQQFREVSLPFHTRDLKEHRIATKFRGGETETATPTGEFIISGQPTSNEELQRDYLRVRRGFEDRRKEVLADQYATYEDLILLNRRLIDMDVRCQRCVNSDRIACFKYDWIERKLLE